MNTVTFIRRWAFPVLALVMGTVFIVAGTRKLIALEFEVNSFANFGYAPWFMYLIGAMQLAGGVLLLLPRSWAAGAALLIPTMLGGIASHVAVGHGIGFWMRAAVYLVLLCLLLWQGVLRLRGGRGRAPSYA